MIKLQVIGHLGRDAIQGTTQGGNKVINFSVAHTEKFKDREGTAKEKTTWVDCSWWTEKDAVLPYLTKGKLVYVEGIPDVRTFDRNDGGTGVSITCRILNVQLLGGSKQEEKKESATAGGESGFVPATGSEEELPF